MQLEERIKELVLEKIADREDLFLVEIKVHANGQVIILIDGDQGVGIQDCAMVSRHVGFHLEEENLIDQAYNLEVSSPGVDAPLQQTRQYHKNIGRHIEVKWRDENGETIVREGELLDVLGEGIRLEAEIKSSKKLPKGRKSPVEELEIPFDKIIITKVLISFK